MMSAQRRTASTTSKRDAATATTAPRRSAQTTPRPVAPAGTSDRPGRSTADRGRQPVVPRSQVSDRTEGMRRGLRETWAEMKKINWPDQETTRNLTLLVIGVSTVLGILLGGIDYLLLNILELF